MNAKQHHLIALRRGLLLLKYLAKKYKGCSFSDLQSACGNISAASLSRLLRVLIAEGMAVKESDGRYKAGTELLRLAYEAARGLSPGEALLPILENLSHESGESAAWFELDANGPFLGAKFEMPEGFHYVSVGQRIAAVLRHGFGQVLAAWSGQEFLERYGPLPLPADAYRRILEEIRTGKILVKDLHETRNLWRLVAPVFKGQNGMLAGALGITFASDAPPQKIRKHLENLVKAAAQKATERLGQIFGDISREHCP